MKISNYHGRNDFQSLDDRSSVGVPFACNRFTRRLLRAAIAPEFRLIQHVQGRDSLKRGGAASSPQLLYRRRENAGHAARTAVRSGVLGWLHRHAGGSLSMAKTRVVDVRRFDLRWARRRGSS